MAFSAARELRDRAIPVRARRTRRSHDIILPRSAGKGQKVNSRRADEVFAEHGYIDPQIILDYENSIEYMLLEIQAGTMLDKYLGTKGHSAYILPSFGCGSDRPYDFSLEVGYKVIW